MNDTAIKNFCIWARNALIEQVETRMRRFSIKAEDSAPKGATSVDGVPLSPDEQRQRAELLDLQRKVGHAALAERAAYTWFNRLVAIRFMELHDYLPCRVRMLSAEDGSFEPQVLKSALDAQIEGLDEARVVELMQAGDDEALFRYLFLAQCDELSSCIPGVFDRVGSAMELLLPDGLLRQDSVVDRLVTAIPESDWDRAEILGWMYQYYNAEVKDAFFKSKAKETPDTIGPATQLFTPEWIVRYMVENSLGRLWMLNFPESELCRKWDYYIAPGEQHEDFIRISGPEDITLCDPACGSGHILVYAFQLLFDMYVERGYREREIPQLILEKNLSGMEIDPRAAQIANLALAMCAREHDRRFFGRGVQADVLVVAPTKFQRDEAGNVIDLPEDAAIMADQRLVDALEHLDEIGSLFNPTEGQIAALRADAERFIREAEAGDLFKHDLAEKLQGALEVCEALARKFDCVVANPPYMGSSSFSPFMSKWIKKNYPDVKSDLFSSFIFRIMDYAKERGEAGIMCPFVWMFIGSYEKLREKMINEKTITSLVQLEYSGFAGATVPICTFTFHNSSIDGYEGGYVRLSDFVGAAVQAPKTREAIANPDCNYFYRRNAKTFTQIPGIPIAYWASEALLRAFADGKRLSDIGKPRQGLATGENARFVREWWEVDLSNEQFGCASIEESVESAKKWFPYNKGGDFRKWYGNNECIIDWQFDGGRIRKFSGAVVRNPDCYFRASITWSKISSGTIAFRYKPKGHIFDVAGTSVFADEQALSYLQGTCNSSVIMNVASMLSPTLNFEVGQIASYPIIEEDDKKPEVVALVNDLRNLSKLDWDSFETSWDFKRHPLL